MPGKSEESRKASHRAGVIVGRSQLQPQIDGLNPQLKMLTNLKIQKMHQYEVDSVTL